MVFSLCEYTRGLEAASDLLLLSTSPPLLLSHPSHLIYSACLSHLGSAVPCSLSLCFIIPCALAVFSRRRCRRCVCAVTRAYAHVHSLIQHDMPPCCHGVLSWGERLGFSEGWWTAWVWEEEKEGGKDREKRRLDQFYSPFVIPTGSMDTQRGL